MKKHRLLKLLGPFLLCMLLLSACSSAAKTTPALPTQDLIVLYTNDVHCAVEGEIGYSGLAALKQQLSAAGNDVLLVDCGDACQGAYIGALSQGEYLIDIMNQIPYDLAIPGNHEFDYGMEQFLALREQASFPYLCANLTRLSDGQSLLPAGTLLEAGGVRLGFVGVTTPGSLTSSTPTSFQDGAGNYIYGFCQDKSGSLLYDAVQQAVDDLRQQGADYVILLAHLGISVTDSPWTSNEVIANTQGIDAVLDGHSHSVLAEERVLNQDGQPVLLSSTGSNLEAVGLLRLTTEGRLSTELITEVSDKDTTTAELIGGIQSLYQEQLQQVVGSTQAQLTINQPGTEQRIVRNMETNLGDFCADAYRFAGQSDVAIVNGGAIRSSISAGDVTMGDMVTVHPFSNYLCVMEVSGQEILDSLEMGCRTAPEENGGFLQVSGLSYEFDMSIPSTVKLDANGFFAGVTGERRVRHVFIGDQPLDPNATYTLTGVDYMLLDGGDGYTMFQDNTVLQNRFSGDVQALLAYISGPLKGQIGAEYSAPYGQGRITLLNAE